MEELLMLWAQLDDHERALVLLYIMMMMETR